MMKIRMTGDIPAAPANTRFSIMIVLLTALCATSTVAREKEPAAQTSGKTTPAPAANDKRPLVTFVELGSVKCVPCKMMQPVMESIGKKYGGQVRIVFHDVWTDSGKTLAEPFKIRAIPTQVFLDQKGAEIFRHEGFYPESEIDKLLQKQGLKVLTAPAKQ
jgi:thioredoxin 1